MDTVSITLLITIAGILIIIFVVKIQPKKDTHIFIAQI